MYCLKTRVPRVGVRSNKNKAPIRGQHLLIFEVSRGLGSGRRAKSADIGKKISNVKNRIRDRISITVPYIPGIPGRLKILLRVATCQNLSYGEGCTSSIRRKAVTFLLLLPSPLPPPPPPPPPPSSPVRGRRRLEDRRQARGCFFVRARGCGALAIHLIFFEG